MLAGEKRRIPENRRAFTMQSRDVWGEGKQGQLNTRKTVAVGGDSGVDGIIAMALLDTNSRI